jgi:hypothetical protein
MSEEFPWATVTVVALTIIAAVAGAAVVIWGDPGTLSFENYLKYMGAYAVSLGLLGIGRGVRAGAKLLAQNPRR